MVVAVALGVSRAAVVAVDSGARRAVVVALEVSRAAVAQSVDSVGATVGMVAATVVTGAATVVITAGMADSTAGMATGPVIMAAIILTPILPLTTTPIIILRQLTAMTQAMDTVRLRMATAMRRRLGRMGESASAFT